MSVLALLVGTVVVVALLIVLLKGTTDDGLGRGEGDELVFYCAAGISKPVKEIVKAYEEEYGVDIVLRFEGSGALLTQLRTHHDAGDKGVNLYLAADKTYIEKAREYGLIEEAIPVAKIRPVIAVGESNGKQIKGIDDLLRKDVRVALANPELASVGRTVKSLLEPSGVWGKLMARQKNGEGVSFLGTVNEAVQAVKLGSADVALVWDSVAQQFGLTVIDTEALGGGESTVMVSIVEPNDKVTPSLHFARYLSSRDKGMPVFKKYHFTTIADADVWEDKVEVPIMAGSMLKPGIEEAIKVFEKREGVRVLTTYNGCGILVAQMKAGERPHAYISCDVTFMDDVQDLFDQSKNLSRNKMVIIVQKGNPHGIKTLQDLANPELKVGLSHPENSALGALTDSMLRELELRDKIYNTAEEVIHSDAGHMIVNQVGVKSLDAAIVYMSNAMSAPHSKDRLDIIEIPLKEAIAIQPYAVAKASTHRYLMQRLMDRITTAKTRKAFESIGFDWLHESGEQK